MPDRPDFLRRSPRAMEDRLPYLALPYCFFLKMMTCWRGKVSIVFTQVNA